MSTKCVRICRFLKQVCSSKYQLRLYCTTSTFYSPDLVSTPPCPIEFPSTCKVRINGVLLQANFKGLKKKPGTAPPADLGQAVQMTGPNRLEMMYSNSGAEKKVGYFLRCVPTVPLTRTEILFESVLGRSNNCCRVSGQAEKTVSWMHGHYVAKYVFIAYGRVFTHYS